VPGLGGAPQWPHDVVGSITHCIGYRAAAVAHGHDIRTLGLDAEPDDGLPEGVVNRVASADERAGLCALASATPGPCWDRLLFSAKESIYKAWFPLTRRWLGFEDTVITINPANGTFTVRLLVPGPVLDGRSLTRFEGRWLVRDGLVLTAIAVPARPELCHRLWLAWPSARAASDAHEGRWRWRSSGTDLWVPKTYAARRYSWMTPPTRSCRRTRK
jgi:4'-phosphopantetheinyl transferase EntD